MSRGNVFKLSGNMALGSNNSGNPYNGVTGGDIENIKNSLRLLKAKQKQKGNNANIQYQDAQESKYEDYPVQKPKHQNRNKESSSYNYEFNAKNHIPQQIYGQPMTHNQTKPQSYSQSNRRISNAKKLSNEAYEYDSLYQKQPDKHQKYNKNQRDQIHKPYHQLSGKEQPPPQKQQKPVYTDNSKPVEDKPIKQVNKQNRVQIVQYDPSEFVTCRAGCGRKFNPDSISKHEKNCKKVFQKKRKVFNAQEHRIVENQQKKLIKKGQIAEAKLQKAKKDQKIPKWKAESLAFRAAVLKQNGNKPMSKADQQMLIKAKDQDMIKCHICGRTFNQKAGQRHITFCESQNKKNAMKLKK